MGTHTTQPSQSRPPAGQAVQTCEVVWWRGYMTGRFHAWTKPSSGVPELVGESPTVRWRHSSPPDQSADAVAALETLIDRLVDQGWTVAQRRDEAWYGYMLWQPSAEPEERGHDVPAPLFERVQSELTDARSHAERERQRRVQAEDQLHRAQSKLLDLGNARPEARTSAAVPPPTSRPRRPAMLLVAYALAVAAAAALFLVGFHSVYEAAVAALTVLALSLGVDSWLVARRLPTQAASSVQPPESKNS
jgi:hypothetical protein